MPLTRTSVQLDPEDLKELKESYPTLTISEILRLALKFTLQNKPKLIVGSTFLAIENSVDLDTVAGVLSNNPFPPVPNPWPAPPRADERKSDE